MKLFDFEKTVNVILKNSLKLAQNQEIIQLALMGNHIHLVLILFFIIKIKLVNTNMLFYFMMMKKGP